MNRFCKKGTYTTLICKTNVSNTVPSKALFESSPILNSESRPERVARAFPIWDRVSVVKTMVCQLGRPVFQAQNPMPRETNPMSSPTHRMSRPIPRPKILSWG